MRSKMQPQRTKTNKVPAQKEAASRSDWFGIVFSSVLFHQVARSRHQQNFGWLIDFFSFYCCFLFILAQSWPSPEMKLFFYLCPPAGIRDLMCFIPGVFFCSQGHKNQLLSTDFPLIGYRLNFERLKVPPFKS